MNEKMIKVSEETHTKLKVQAYTRGETLIDYMKYIADRDIGSSEETLNVVETMFKDDDSSEDFIKGFMLAKTLVFLDKEELEGGSKDSEYYKAFGEID